MHTFIGTLKTTYHPLIQETILFRLLDFHTHPILSIIIWWCADTADTLTIENKYWPTIKVKIFSCYNKHNQRFESLTRICKLHVRRESGITHSRRILGNLHHLLLKYLQ